jgi:hypothetical protein
MQPYLSCRAQLFSGVDSAKHPGLIRKMDSSLRSVQNDNVRVFEIPSRRIVVMCGGVGVHILTDIYSIGLKT